MSHKRRLGARTATIAAMLLGLLTAGALLEPRVGSERRAFIVQGGSLDEMSWFVEEVGGRAMSRLPIIGAIGADLTDREVRQLRRTAPQLRFFPDSRIDRVTPLLADTPSGPAGSVKVVDFTLCGQRFQGHPRTQ